VLTGETKLKTPNNEYFIKAGDCAFAKKGSVIMRSHTNEDFCELIVFLPDDFIKTVILKHKLSLHTQSPNEGIDTVISLFSDEVLITYFHSLLTYFQQPNPPSKTLLKLKFEELIINILTNNKHRPLQYYFSELCSTTKPSLKEIMEANFPHNLSIGEFARMCSRSLSSFKLEFKSIYHTTPGKWLLDKRLDYSQYLLEATEDTLDEISFVSGFENKSHFIRVFKRKYGLTPGKYRIQIKT